MFFRPLFLGGEQSIPVSLGPYEPGCTDVMTGDSRDDGLFVRLYYPSALPKAKENSDKWIPWLTHDNYITGFASVLGLWRWVFYSLINILSGGKKLPAAGDAPVHKDIGLLRTAVFSHGMGGCRHLYGTFCCELAAHGFVVAAVEHRDESASMTWYMEGKQQKWLPFRHINERGENHQRFRAEQVERRSLEASQSLDLLRDLNDGVDIVNAIKTPFDLKQLKGRLDLSSPVMAGHSFGGATALLTLARNQAFRCGIILDPWLFPLRQQHDDLPSQISQPLLCVTSSAFPIPPNIRALEKFMAGPQPSYRQYQCLRHTTHEQQTDTVFLIGTWLNPLMKKLDFTLAIRLNNALIIKFLREQGGLKIESDADDILLTKAKKYIIDGFTVDGRRNKSKHIPTHYISIC